MRKHMLGLVAVLAAFLLAPTAAFALADAGVVLMAKGEATAKGADGIARKLDRKSAINVGDTLTTGAASDVSVRMKDGTVISLGADTQFAVNAYSSKQAGDAADSAALKLVKGSLMQVSGSMDKSSYKLETPVSTLGIRGTIFKVVANADGSVSVEVAQGAITMQKSDGTLALVSEGQAMQMLQDGTATMVPQGVGYFESMADLAATMAIFYPDDAVEFTAKLAAAFPEQAGDIIEAAKKNMTPEQQAALDEKVAEQTPQAGPAADSALIQTGSAGAGGGVSP